MEHFKPEYRMACKCTWCKTECDPSYMKMYVKSYKKRLFRQDIPIDYFQLCPKCDRRLDLLAIKIHQGEYDD